MPTQARSAERGNIFLSYRREDTRHLAGRLYDRLASQFGSTQVFMDVDSIDPGADFKSAIEDAVSSCEIVLALIGPAWLTVQDERGRPRLDDPNDFVVLEIAAALDRKIRVIPVLADGASIPRSEDLPESLAPLALRNATRLDHETFRSDADALLAAVERSLKSAGHNEAHAVQPTPPRDQDTVTQAHFASSLPSKRADVTSESLAKAVAARRGSTESGADSVEHTASSGPNENRLTGRVDDGRLRLRHRHPIWAYVRDIVDSRPRLLGLFMPMAFVVVTSVLVPVPTSVQQHISLFSLGILILMIGNGVLLGRTTVAKARAKFPNTKFSAAAIALYAVGRASQVRRIRMPRPRIGRGQIP